MNDLTHKLYQALASYPCRCQMTGGAKWHFRAQMEVAKQCSRCATMAEYEATYPNEGSASIKEVQP
jgi:hypothetical protein